MASDKKVTNIRRDREDDMPPRAARIARKTEKMSRTRIVPDQLGYSLQTNVKGFVEIFGQLIDITPTHVVFRHKKARATRIVVSYFDRNDVALIHGSIGEKSSILVNTLHTVYEVKNGGTMRQAKNGFTEIVEANGDRTLLNTTSNNPLVSITIQGDEEDVKKESSRRASAN